jgi:hypothetical protein
VNAGGLRIFPVLEVFADRGRWTQTFDALSKNQQDVIMALGVEMEKFGTAEAMADDTAWKDYAQKTPLSAELLKLAEGIPLS